MLFGVANSIFKKDGFDPLATLKFAKRNKYSFIQIHIESITGNKDKNIKKKIKDFIDRNNLSLIIHFPNSIENIKNDIELIETTKYLLNGAEIKNIILHLENKDYKTWIDLISFLNDNNFHPLLENYYKEFTEEEIRKELNLLNSLKNNNKIRYGFLFDIPRFYNYKIISNIENDKITKYIDQYFSMMSNNEISFFHIIDSKTYKQDRGDWCQIGKGIIINDQIINKIKNTIKPIIIFEFECKKFNNKSRLYLEKYY